MLLKYALTEMAQQINREKLSPQEALTKVSKELDLSPNFIKLASAGINVALHYDHFKKHADAKDSDFPITRAEDAIKTIFGEKEKTGNDLKANLDIDVHYSQAPINFDKIATDPNYGRAYREIASADAKNTYFPMSAHGVFEKSALYLDRLEKDVENLKTEKCANYGTVNSLFSKMVGEFSKDAAARPSFGEFESQVYSLHGERAVPYLDLIHQTTKTAEERGVHDAGYQMFQPAYVTGLFGEFLKTAEKLAAANTLLKQAEELLAFEKAYTKEAFKQRQPDMAKAASVLPEINEAVIDTSKIEDPVMKLAAEKMNDEIGARQELQKMFESGEKKAEDGVLGNLYDSFFQGQIQSPEQDAAKSEKENLDRKLLLEELMTTDPVISKIPPGKVVAAYSQMLRLSPELSKEKELVRSTLRLAGESQAVTPFDADQLIKADTDLQKQRMLSSGKLPMAAAAPTA